MHECMMHVGVLPCTPAAAPPIESRIKFCDILLLGGAAAGANKGTMGLGWGMCIFSESCDQYLPTYLYL